MDIVKRAYLKTKEEMDGGLALLSFHEVVRAEVIFKCPGLFSIEKVGVGVGEQEEVKSDLLAVEEKLDRVFKRNQMGDDDGEIPLFREVVALEGAIRGILNYLKKGGG